MVVWNLSLTQQQTVSCIGRWTEPKTVRSGLFARHWHVIRQEVAGRAGPGRAGPGLDHLLRWNDAVVDVVQGYNCPGPVPQHSHVALATH